MKTIKFVVHPFVVLGSFFMVLISGEGWAGFYAIYIFMGLLHGVVHSILGIIGVILVLLGHSSHRSLYWKTGLNVSGCCLLLLSLFFFFHNDQSNYNIGTFYQIVPLATVILFAIVSTSFLLYNSIMLFKSGKFTESDSQQPNQESATKKY